ncbi:MAG: flagellar export protein FliJ [Ignavibacteria bacterium]|nr:MAG: flagellar export protein FliJ [Ignavibacteria bacterium]KAF0160121.1 MAG: flagellar export protein FliJ [Ignavibacteria bacterium]
MAKFKFKYESIMKVKLMYEKKIQEEISRINKDIDDLLFEAKHLRNESKRVSLQMTEKSIKAADFHSTKMYCTHLQHQIDLLERKIESCLKRKEEKQKELVERKKEIKSLEIIKENDYQNFLIEERSSELKSLNEVALRNFNGSNS